MNPQAHTHLRPDAIYSFDARGIAKRFRHAAIFGALDALRAGETMRFVNDHDPLPLLQQLQQRYVKVKAELDELTDFKARKVCLPF